MTEIIRLIKRLKTKGRTVEKERFPVTKQEPESQT